MSRPQGIWNDVPRRGRGARVHRPTAWIRLSTRIAAHPDMVGLPSDECRWLWIVVLCEAKHQPEAGAFRSEAQLASLLDKFQRRKLARLFAAGLLEHRQDGAVVVHNWSLWQTGQRSDRTNAERQRRHREKVSDGSPPGRLRAAAGPGESTPTVRDWSEVEPESDDVTAVMPSLRVTRSNGGPPIGDNAVTAASLAGGVTAGREEGFDRRRDLAAIIRNAPNDAMRHRYRRIFDKTYGHLYERSVA